MAAGISGNRSEGGKVKKLNDNERKVLLSMLESSAGNGHAFGITSDVRIPGMTGKQIGGYMADLEKKGFVVFYEEIEVDFYRKVVQFTLEPDAFEFAGLPRDTYTQNL